MDDNEAWATEPDLARLRTAYQALSTSPDDAIAELQRLIDSGSTMAMVYLGYAFEKGLGIKADASRAIDWYDRAAKRGCLLAKMYLGGLLVEAGRYDDARRVLSDKALKDDAPSMYWLARLSVLEKMIIKMRNDYLSKQALKSISLPKGC